jgi:transcriptional regulator with XRE-family HTH domain
VVVRVDETLGARLRRLRTERGCSLSELARRSGIGKGTISELENDRRGARLGTLFALTTALGAPLGALLPDEAATGGGAVRGDSVAAVLLGRWPVGPQLVEVYRAVVGEERQESAPHAEGVEETVTVVRGRVRVGGADGVRELGAGESLRYPGDRPHRFQALGGPAEVVLLMHYPAAADLPTAGRTDHAEGTLHRDR